MSPVTAITTCIKPLHKGNAVKLNQSCVETVIAIYPLPL